VGCFGFGAFCIRAFRQSAGGGVSEESEDRKEKTGHRPRDSAIRRPLVDIGENSEKIKIY